VKPAQQKKLDAAERAREKKRSREADARALKAGKKKPADLQRENAHFAGLKVRFDPKRAELF
jgi:hypothetical protein